MIKNSKQYDLEERTFEFARKGHILSLDCYPFPVKESPGGIVGMVLIRKWSYVPGRPGQHPGKKRT